MVVIAMIASPTAQAADTTLTLACQGTMTATTAGTEDKPEPISMGIIVNFTKKTVHGFGDPLFGEQRIKITGVTETAVYFSPDDKFQNMSQGGMGAIDRVTGDLWADFTATDAKTGKTITSTSYALKCRPTQRMF
jgi:hypothetical protein